MFGITHILQPVKFGATTGTKVANYTALITGDSTITDRAAKVKAALVGAGWSVYSVSGTGSGTLGIWTVKIAAIAGCNATTAQMISWASQFQNVIQNMGLFNSVLVSFTGATTCIQNTSTAGSSSQAQTIMASMGSNSNSGSTYTVQRGDTLGQIATRFGTTVAALAAINGITNVNLIEVGQVLRVSGTASGPKNPVPVVTTQNVAAILDGTPPLKKTSKSKFDELFFDGAGALTGAGIAILIVGGVVVFASQRK